MTDWWGDRRWIWIWGRSLAVVLILALASCAIPQIKAEDRLFLPITVDLLDVYNLPPQEFEGTTVGGLSALAYDRPRDRLYALSDDRGRFGPARFYTLTLAIGIDGAGQPQFDAVTLEGFTPLLDAEGNPYPNGSIDPEGIALSPRDTLFVSSEGDVRQNAPPFIGEFDRQTGQILNTLPLPERYLPDAPDSPTRGVQNNLSLEALTVTGSSSGAGMTEPFRLFVATESALVQDYIDDPSQPLNTRFLHYLIGDDQTTLIAEHRYPLDLEPTGAVANGLTDMLSIDPGGHFLALERAFGLRGVQVKLFQLATGGATDISAIVSLAGDVSGISPIRKQLVLNFDDTPLAVDNLEGMTLGPRLPDGSQSLLLVSDNNFDGDRTTQLILLRLTL
ncbi:esterase-like activity of phytase family protein [Nodosilinea sp. LEGE 07088]|uniref:esterase-like activity of phytase family protein n=1 Tax=Nodosilinea sp. LEGE 07088 TaxID=2777968 RepID=UPI00187EA2C8|nr:esterase-like activity of phytase family protein [Nodosilinea sp. LEGE 07088]MBE9137895.1 esterase-like activity of phytase family protein [Nodosilinea sp. LEGE 07088]